ncbi:hypothetical protein [Chryseobacterium sp. CT-SW4]|uniref:hypothetical protein n=1 Tax=Chryseobacterium sp. SW-1 TaxID=3157343 RepID=UPI003B01ED30
MKKTKFESLQGKKLGNLKDIYAGKLALQQNGICSGTGTDDDPAVLETLTLSSNGGGKNDGCD